MYIRKIVLAVLLIGLVVMGFISYTIYQTIFGPNTSFEEEEMYIFIESEATYEDVFQQLKPYLADSGGFHQVAEKKSYPQNLRPGKYRITNGMNNNELVNALRVNNIPVQVKFNNQHHLPLLAGKISKQIEADSTALINAFMDQEFLAKNQLTEENLMSIFIPNTYQFFWNTKAEEFRDRMLKEYQNFWTSKRREKAKALNLSTFEVITLASIVQKETAKVDERPRVAGVYVNRLKANMKLQADPTLIFALKESTQNFDTIVKRVLNKDKLIQSKYNTYLYAGLPPGPIAMPDISSIDAVLNYEDHQYYYFVADVQNPGYHKFAKNLRQHNQYANQYRNWVNKQKIYR